MLQNAYLVAKIGADTAENEQYFAEILPKNGNYPLDSWTPGDLEETATPSLLGDTTADRQNFGKMLLVFGCIGTDFCKKIRVLQHFSKSTRLSS